MSGPERTIDLASLNEAEREVLGLLAQGHTVKSVAAATEHSYHSVNERLREARRKTGVGSSRELARLLRSQKIRDEQFGVAAPGSGAPGLVAEAAAAPRRGIAASGIIIMTTITLAGLAAWAFALQGASAPEPEPDPNTDTGSVAADPLFGKILPGDRVDPAAMYRQIRAEERDEAWAPRMESALAKRYAAIPGIGDGEGALRVLCGRTLCEIVGELPSAPAIDQAMKEIQGDEIREELEPSGLSQVAALFGGTRGDRSLFAAYWRRNTAQQ